MKQEITILYAEDDETLSFVTMDTLVEKGYRVIHALRGDQAMEIIRKEEFDLALLDVMLPEVDGFTLAQEIRRRSRDVPILFLTAKSLKEDRLHGFELGADDYIVKPFSIQELIYKIEVFLRRSQVSGIDDRNRFVLGRSEFNYFGLELHTPEGLRKLTQKEADLLKYLCTSKNQIAKRSQILEEVWGEDDYFMGRSLDVFISRLRKYLANDNQVAIENIHGVGFKLSVRDD